MKKILKQTASIILASTMVLSTGIFNSFATKFGNNPMAEIEGSATLADTYKSNTCLLKEVYNEYKIAWQDALESKNMKCKTLKLLSDWTISEDLVVPEGKSINIDMNGHMIKRVNSKKHGKVINVGKNAELNIYSSNNSTVHMGYNKDGLWASGHSSGKLEKDIAGAIITSENCANNASDCIDIYDGASVTIKDVSVLGNKNSHDGGAINMCGKDSLLNISDCNIKYNKARYGGGISVIGENCKINILDKSIIGKNSSNGGYGGGIYISGENCKINMSSDSNIYSNHANKYGGGVYINAKNASINGGNITDNVSNIEDGGGGIYVKNNISLSGEIVIKDNIARNKASNLYLDKDAYIKGNPSPYSYIGVSCNECRKISNAPGTYTAVNFVIRNSNNNERNGSTGFMSDKTDRHIEWNTNSKSKNYRYLMMVLGEAKNDVIVEKKRKTTGSEIVNGEYCNGQTVYRGYFSYSAQDSKGDQSSIFYYSDGYFKNAPEEYNEHLATTSMDMAMAAFNSNKGSNTDYRNKPKNIISFLEDIGCDKNSIYTSDTYRTKPTANSIAVALGTRKMTFENDEYTLIPIAVRGAGYESEWIGNVTIGETGEAQGFASAADTIVNEYLKDYITDHNLGEKLKNGKVKFWVVGYSRAGATANLTSKRLVDKYSSTGNDVYGYCFEAPQGGDKNLKSDKYNCIHNCINRTDIVPLVAPSDMDFIRYGVDHYVPDVERVRPKEKNKYLRYNDRKELMLRQLKAVNRFITFDDYFHYATINYIAGAALNLSDVIVKTDIPANKQTSIEGFFKNFIHDFQEWGFSCVDKTKNKDFRYYYANKAIYGNQTLQTTVQDIFLIINSKTDNELGGIGELLLKKVSKIGIMVFIKLYASIITGANGKDTINNLWKQLVVENSDITGKLSKNEIARLEKDFKVLLNMALPFISKDYIKNNQLYIGTFIYNMDRILQSHFPEINLAWLRSYDSYYNNEINAIELI